MFGEFQLRSTDFYHDFNYYEVKGGFNYTIHPNVRVTFGAGNYNTYQEVGTFVLPKSNDELRLWPQVLFLQQIRKLNIEHRYRSEFRFTSNGYRNRFRYRAGLSYPFGWEINGQRPFQIGAGNELFFSDKAPYFEKNRFSVSFNFYLSKATVIQLGYMYQFNNKDTSDNIQKYLQIGLYFELSSKHLVNPVNGIHLKDN